MLTGKYSNLQLQAEKIARFSNWSGMEVNARKCAASALLHGEASTGLLKSPDEHKVIKRHLVGNIHVGNGTVPYLPPDKPYRYLGVLLNLTLNWSHQYIATTALLTEQACQLQTSFATPAQKLQVFRSKSIAAMRYVFSTTAFSPMDIKRLDSAMTRFTERTIGLMGCTPNVLIHEDISRGGLVMMSLLHPYVQEQTTTIVKSLHDTGRLGYITKALLIKQLGNMGMLAGVHAWQHLRYCSLVRKLAFMQEAGITLKGPMEIALAGNVIDKALRQLQSIIKGSTVNKLHRITMPLYELGMYDFSRLCDVAGRNMIDADALSRLPGLCSRVTGRHRKALNRLTLLVNGQDWVGSAPAHAYQKTTALPLPTRLIKRGLSLADIGTHLRPIQRKIDSFRCSTHTNPRAEPARVHRADQAGARPRSQTMGNIAGPAQVAQAQHEPHRAWTGRTRAANKGKAPETGSLGPEAAAQQLLPKPRKSMRRRRKKRVSYPLLSRECEDVSMVEHIDWKWLDPENGERGADMDGFCKEISKTRELGKSVTFEVIRGLYNEQERPVKIFGHQLVDGGA